MQQQSFDAVFEKGVFRPLTHLQFTEGQPVKIIVESQSISTKKKKCFPTTGIIAQLTANPILIPDFHPLTREESHLNSPHQRAIPTVSYANATPTPLYERSIAFRS